jgi:hypothetical protein
MSIKSTIAAVAASPFLLAGAAFAGPYVNVESNLSYPDGDYSSTATDVHLGYEGTAGAEGKIAYYVQGGPSLNHAEATDDTETEISGKIGGSYAISSDLAAYGEISGSTNGEDSDGDTIRDYGAKVGVKFTF